MRYVRSDPDGRSGNRPGQTELGNALVIAAVCLAFDAFVQLQSFLLYAVGGVTDSGERVAFLARFPFLLVQHVLVAGLLGGLYLLVGASRTLRIAYLLFIMLVNGLIVLDQQAYRMFMSHIRPSMAEGSLAEIDVLVRNLTDSILADVGPVFYLNLLLWLGCGVLIARRLFQPKRAPAWLGRMRMRWSAAAAAAYLLISLTLVFSTESYGLAPHPLFTLASFGGPPTPVATRRDIPLAELSSLRYGSYTKDHETDHRLADFRHALRQRPTRPNIVLVVLESVGAIPLFEEGPGFGTTAPFLSELAHRGIVFDTVYVNFPSTTRTHVPLMTGGQTITWGRVSEELTYPYQGPTLPGQLKALGYRTALFSAQDLRFENLDDFYKSLPYDRLIFAGDDSGILPRGTGSHSWGGDDAEAMQAALNWVDEAGNSDGPFFLQLMTNATHHPYAAPPGLRGPMEGTDARSRYYNALHYSDSIIGRMVEALEARGLRDDTVIVVTGDHGQAFGIRHGFNRGHRNGLYEENIRTFFLLSAGGAIRESVWTHRPAGLGDLMPTLLGLSGTDGPDLMGQDLLSPRYYPRLAYFHKNAHPARWGLRDGRWKYTAQHTGDAPQLYDLERDPREQENLADRHPQLVALYQELCANWYLKTNHAYIAWLQDFPLVGGRGLERGDLGFPGPKTMGFGYRTKKGAFVETNPMHPDQEFLIWNRWVPYASDKTIRYRVEAPDGRFNQYDFSVAADWDMTWLKPGLDLGKQPGVWSVSLWDGDQELISGRFLVSGDAKRVTEADFEWANQ